MQRVQETETKGICKQSQSKGKGLIMGRWGKALDITYLIIVVLGLLLALGTIILAWMDSPTL